MPFGQAGLIDDFNRANSTGISNANLWATDYDAAGRSSFDIVSNQAKAAAGGFSSNYTVPVYGPDQEVWATLVALPVTQAARLQCRLIFPGTANVCGYEINYDINDINSPYIVRIDKAARTDLGFFGVALSAGDGLGLEAIGNALTAYRFTGGLWVPIGTVKDDLHKGQGAVAMAAQNDTAVIWENFGGGTIGKPFVSHRMPLGA